MADSLNINSPFSLAPCSADGADVTTSANAGAGGLPRVEVSVARPSRRVSFIVQERGSDSDNRDRLISMHSKPSILIGDECVNPMRSLSSLAVIESGSSDDAKASYISKKTLWRPIATQLFAMLLGWLYLIIPSSNYWVRSLVRDQWFSILVATSYIELQDTCMPDTAPSLYILCYLLAYFVPPVWRTAVWFCGVQDNYYVGTVIPFTPAFVVWGLYFYDGYVRRYMHAADSMDASTLYDAFKTVDNVENGKMIALASLSSIELLKPTNASDLNESPVANKDNDNVKENDHVIASLRLVGESVSASSVTDDYTGSGSHLLLGNYGIFRFLPRFMFSNPNMRPRPRTCWPDRLVVWGYASAFIFMWIVLWEFVMNITVEIRKYSSSPSGLETLFILFVCVNNLLRMIFKRIGIRNDRCKQGTTSMFFIAETLCLLFYYTFYRVLFQSVSSWSVFLTFQVMHLSFEWLCYPFRASATFAKLCLWIRDHGGWVGNFIADLFGSKYVTFEDWKRFIALDFGIRVTVVLSSGIGICAFLWSISALHWVQNSLKESYDKEWNTVMWIAVAVGLELLNACAINFLFFSRQTVSVYDMLLHAYADDRFCFLTAIISAIMFLNPVYAFTTST
jgi:hypothetical protein